MASRMKSSGFHLADAPACLNDSMVSLLDFTSIQQAALQLLKATHFQVVEESISHSTWIDISNQLVNYFSSLKQQLQSIGFEKSSGIRPPVQLLILLAGTIANQSTSKKLQLPDADIHGVAIDLLACLVSLNNVSSTRELLLLQPNSSQPKASTLAQQILKICVVQLVHAPKSDFDQLNFRPLHRDALIWLTSELQYPELAGEDFISVLQPFGLQLIGDYRLALQLAGFSILQQLSIKARIADWRQSNRAEAVISELFQLRIGSTPGSSEHLLQETYSTLLNLIALLEPKKRHEWYSKLADRLLFDLSMEMRRSRQNILVRHLGSLISIMKSDFVEHTRRFLNALSNVLLGPRTPNYLRKTLQPDALDTTVHSEMLRCLHTLVCLSWPLVCPSLLPCIIPPLITFVDLEHHYNERDCEQQTQLPDSQLIAQQLQDLFDLFLQLEPRLLENLFLPAAVTVPALLKFLPTCNSTSVT